MWDKNWPEIEGALTGGLPEFIGSRHPRELKSEIPVFAYHVVDVPSLEADLQYLADNGYTTIDADGLFEHITKKRSAPENTVVLTFDDGGRNLYEVAFPLLRQYSMKAVAFIATQFHREENSYSGCANETLHPLSWGQIWEMHSSGLMDFQSHTHEHRYVPRWPEQLGLEGVDSDLVHALAEDPLTMEEDFKRSKEILEHRLSKAVEHLAFPSWDGTDEALRIGAQIGFKAFWWGVLPHRPINRPGSSPLHVVRIDRRYLRRLPGAGRESLAKIIAARYGKSGSRYWRRIKNSVAHRL
jgi:peptidoglycan/xylan/chitin deacetylase (PgdA/CDA1 family)